MIQQIRQHYDLGHETNRLTGLSLERLRTESILFRNLPQCPSVILDIGGGDGVYAFPLAAKGYEVHLVDPIELHVQQAIDKNKSASATLKSIQAGDARKLNFEDQSADVVLYLGPLYHLQLKADRMQALKEAYRVLKKGGLFVSAHISKFTSLIDGIQWNHFEDPNFVKIVDEDLNSGCHHNPANHPAYFTEAFFQHPLEAKSENALTGFSHANLVSIEGPIWMIRDLDKQLSDPKKLELILSYLEKVERDETIVGASSHYAIVAVK
jgi:ubiquinone/menaquinone biosynthesis C-methylase UbiE